MYSELRMKDQIEERSSQLLRNLSSCKKKAWKKKSRLERDSNPWLLRCRCSALPTELSSQLGASSDTDHCGNFIKFLSFLMWMFECFTLHVFIIISFLSLFNKRWLSVAHGSCQWAGGSRPVFSFTRSPTKPYQQTGRNASSCCG